MGSETFNGFTSTGITLTASGADNPPFTVTATGTINASGAEGVYSTLAAPLLLNQGTIIGTIATDAEGVELADGGTIVNSANAVIRGDLDGVLINGAAGTVINAGTIRTSIRDGVILADGGTIINTGTIAGAAAVSLEAGNSRVVAGNGAVFSGVVAASGSNNTLEFAGTGGTVASIGTQFTGFQTLAFDAGAAWTISGSASSLEGLATITGVAPSDVIDVTGFAAASARYTAGVGLVLTSGTTNDLLHLSGSETFAIISDGHGGTDIVSGVSTLSTSNSAGVTLASLGTFGAPFTVTPTGTINASGAAGVYSTLSAPALLNQGSIIATIASEAEGVELTDGGTIVNSANAVIRGALDAVLVSGAAGTVTNAGTIAGTKRDGVLLSDGGTLINTGTIAGAVQLEGAGNSRVVAGNAAVFTGVVAASGSNNTLEFAGTGGTVASIGTQFTGFQTLAFDAGAVWTISGSASSLEGLATITGIAPGDVIDVTGFAATSASYTAGLGLALNNGTVSDVLQISGTDGFAFGFGSDGNGGTDIFGTVNTLATSTTGGITLTSTGEFRAPFTVTPTGTITASTGAGIYSTLAAAFLRNEGSIIDTGGNGAGVLLTDGGTVINTGTIAGSVAVDIEGPGGARVVAGNGAIFVGAVEATGTGNTLELAGIGGTVASIGTQFTGFQTVAFDPDAAWTISGSAPALAGLATITGVTLTDTIDVTGFAATAASYTAGIGLVLSSGTGQYVLKAGWDAGFNISTDGNGGTDIGFVPTHTLSGTNTGGITLSTTGLWLSPFTVTQAGTITGSGNGVYSTLAGAYLLNAGSISSTSGDGVGFKNGGTVVNAGTIAGGAAAVDLAGTGNSRVVAQTGAVFSGSVEAAGAGNTLELAGTGGTVASIGTQFTGFQTIAFDPGAVWTISGDAANLTGLSTITGFDDGDVIDLTGFAATSASYTAGVGLQLAGGGTSALLNVDAAGAITITSDGHGGTDIALIPTHTLSNLETGGIALSTGRFASPFTITPTGIVQAGLNDGVTSTLASAFLLNEGTIISADNAGGTQGGVSLGNGGTVVNAGTITGTAGDGVYIGGAGSVTNSGSGVISGGGTGVDDDKTWIRVYNSGTITGTASYGVYLINQSTIFNNGTISGGVAAVRIGGHGGSRVVVEAGAVFNGVVEVSGSYNTLELAGGSSGTLPGLDTGFTGFATIDVDNGATWSLNGTNSLPAGAFLYINGNFTNAGQIVTDRAGVRLRYEGTLTNTGTLISQVYEGLVLLQNGDVTNSGLIEGVSSGIYSLQGLTTIANTGTIIARSGDGIYVQTGATNTDTITNTGSGAIITGADDGIHIAASSGNNGYIDNAATITGTIGYGVYLGFGGAVTNSAGGVITGGRTGVKASKASISVNNSGTIGGSASYGVYLVNQSTIFNSGTISGGVAAVRIGGTGGARVVAEGGAVFTGAVQATGTGNTLEFSGSGGTVASIGGQFTGFQTVAFDAGSAWTISGDAADLGALASITGVTLGDEIDLTGFAAASATYTAGIGLRLSSAASSLLLTVSGSGVFDIASDGNGGTDIVFGTQTLSSTHTLATYTATGINLTTTGLDLAPFTVTSSGTINTGGAAGVYSGLAAPFLLNEGTIIGRTQYGVKLSAGTVINAGTISGVAAGVLFTSGNGVVANTLSTAVIYGAEDGVVIDGTHAAATVNNAGTIIGQALYGLRLLSGGTVTNSGTIAGGEDAVYVRHGSFTLNALAGGVFAGAVLDHAGTGVLNLAGATAGTLAMSGSFSGFAALNFGPAVWTLAGTSSELANGQVITGFTLGDEIDLTDFAAASAAYTAGTGLVLSNNAASETIGFSGGASEFAITSDGNGGTDILFGTQTLSTYTATGITLTATGPDISPFTVTQTGTVASTGNGVYSTLYPAYLWNQGSITSTGGDAVYFENGGVITNSGSGVITGGLAGVHLRGFGYVANYAAITGGSGNGLYVTKGGYFNNFGTTAAITGGMDGVHVSGAYGNNGFIYNEGSITGSARDGVYLGGGGAVTNSASGVISGGKTGVDDSTDWIRVYNYGVITGAVNYGVYLKDQSILVNSGTIAGGVAAVEINGTGDAHVVDVAGAVFIGDVDVAGTGNTLELAGASGSGTLTGLGTSFNGFTEIAVDGGSNWVLDGVNTLAAGTTFTNTGNLTLASTTLGGLASLENDGTIIIDPSTLTVDGSLTGTGVVTIAAGSTLDVTGDVAAGQTIVFDGAGAELQITDTADIAGTLSGAGTIDITGLPFTSFSSASFNSVADLLGITFAGATSPLQLNGDFAGDSVFAQSDGSGGTELVLSPLCYLHGTRILTPTGQVCVENLKIGDAVVTRFGGIQRIKWLGRQSYAPPFIANNPDKWPVCIKAGALAAGVPARDLYVSPGHSMLLGDTLVLASNLVNGITITQTRPDYEVNYVQIDLGGHDCVIAEGTWSESYADGPGLRAQFHNAAEFYTLYPDEPPVEALRLCAGRPERGPKLAAALLPVASRAAAGIKPGTLEGFIDIVSDWKIQAWARDIENPELPVCLEILAGGEVIGTVLACDFREDLRQAGKGRGYCAFAFTPPLRLCAEIRATLTIRRAADAAELPGMENFRPQPEPATCGTVERLRVINDNPLSAAASGGAAGTDTPKPPRRLRRKTGHSRH